MSGFLLIKKNIFRKASLLACILCMSVVALCSGCGKKTAACEVSITFAGDVTMHRKQLVSCYDSKGGCFDVSSGLSYVKGYLSDSTYTVANLETTLAGPYGGPVSEVYGYSGYPCFNSPDELAAGLKDAGVDMLQTVNNHCMDTGIGGLNRTLDVLDKTGMDHVGTYRNKEEQDALKIIHIGDVAVGIIACTWEINSNAYVSDAPYAFNSLHSYDKSYVDKLCRDIDRLKNSGADLVCVLIHWGQEYTEQPDEDQIRLADALLEGGADVIIGTHPHSIQPVDVRDIKQPDGTTRKGYIFYSLGDFYSNAVYDHDGVNKDIGYMVKLILDEETCRIKDVLLIPTYIHADSDSVETLPILDVLENTESYTFLTSSQLDRVAWAKTHVLEIASSMNADFELMGDTLTMCHRGQVP